MGNEYYFRVYSENFCGLSDLPGVSKNTARIVKTGLTTCLRGPPSGLGFDLASPPLPPTPPDSELMAPGDGGGDT